MKILALEASGKVAGCALWEDDALLGEISLQNGLTHSQTLMPMVDNLFRSLNMEIGSIDAVAVTSGPGSFTGLRIGAATVKGLAYALQVPVIPVPTLECLAAGLYMDGSAADSCLVCPIMDARRGQVYTGIYRYRNGRPVPLIRTRAAETPDLLDILEEMAPETVIFTGDGVPVFRQMILERKSNIKFSFAPPHLARQRAAATAYLAMEMYKERGEEAFVAADRFRPEYLRLSQAERERNAGLLKIRVRRMEKSDVEAALKVEQASFSEPWTKEMFDMTLLLPYARYYVAETEDGTIAGICGVRILSDTGEISNVAVLPDYRSRKIGRRMLEKLLDDAMREGIFEYTLEVRASNRPAVSLYEGLGFKSEGVRKDFYKKPVEDALIMWRRV